MVFSDGVTASTPLGKIEFEYSVQLLQPVPMTEVGEFNSYSSGIGVSSPFDVTQT